MKRDDGSLILRACACICFEGGAVSLRRDNALNRLKMCLKGRFKEGAQWGLFLLVGIIFLFLKN